MIVPTFLSPETQAALLAESRRRAEAMRHRRDLRERVASLDFEAHLSDEQQHQRNLFEARMRANALRRPPSIFGPLGD